MKHYYITLILSLFLIGCEPPHDHAAEEAFERNSKAVMAYIEGFQNESIDYDAIYSKDLTVIRATNFGAKDSTRLAEFMVNDRKGWEKFDFKLITPVNLLPGVDAETHKMDGSVRYYGTWEVTLPATDTTEARVGQLKIYESFEFDDEGKIILQQFYGDGSGLFMYMNGIDNNKAATP